MSKKSKAQWTVSTFSEADGGETSKSVKATTSRKRKQPTKYIGAKLNNYEPQTVSELALTNLRIDPLSGWFTSLKFQKKKGRVLLLTGPPGCGKTAAVHVIAKEHQMDIIDWVLHDTVRHSTEMPSKSDDLVAFRDFVLRAGRYAPIGSTNRKKVVVAEDLPDSITKYKNEFFAILREYVASAKNPMIIIYSHTDPNHLVNPDMKIELNLETVIFKMVPLTCIRQALNRVILIHGLATSKFSTVVNNITESCGGNLRKAISELQIYLLQGGKGSDQRIQPLGQHKALTPKKDKINQETGLFHAVGRVLYAKRQTQPSGPSTSRSSALLHNPMETVDRYLHLSNQFVHLLHNNYLDIFSSMESIAQASECLSMCDMFTAEWREEELTEIGFAVCVSGMMNASHDPVKKWKPITSSGWVQDRNLMMKKNENIKSMFPDLRSLSVEFNTDFVPIFNNLCEFNGITVKRCKFLFSSHDESDLVTQICRWRSRDDLKGPKLKLGYEDDDDDLTIEEISD